MKNSEIGEYRCKIPKLCCCFSEQKQSVRFYCSKIYHNFLSPFSVYLFERFSQCSRQRSVVELEKGCHHKKWRTSIRNTTRIKIDNLYHLKLTTCNGDFSYLNSLANLADCLKFHQCSHVGRCTLRTIICMPTHHTEDTGSTRILTF